MTGKREPYRGNLERADGRTKLEEWIESRRVAKLSNIYVCPICDYEVDNVVNISLGFTDWSGIIVCPDCKAPMLRKEE